MEKDSETTDYQNNMQLLVMQSKL